MDWTDEIIARLRLLWSEGHSTAEIGRRLGVSKNAVVGKAHRLELPARPSPIRRGGSPEESRRSGPRRSVGPTLPPLVSTPVIPHEAPRRAEPRVQAGADPKTEALAPARNSVLRAVARPSGGRTIACCWPIGDPGTRSFKFCGADSLASKPYCAEHAQLAYVKVRERREDAA